ncbi:MAG TPA: hypothetical protein VFH95_07490 [Candidatus Kapabacteria bacterium]|nr:hypothetical protein [Candidatus Kapabacteria bacterium]
MSVFDHNDFAKREAKWEKLNVEHGGRFQTRVRELLALPVALTMIEARIKTLAEEGWNDGKIAERLGIKEKTVYNHSSKIRKLAGVGREVPFRMVFFPPPPRGNGSDERDAA